MKHNLTIIIPAYNELKNFKSGCLDKIDQYLLKKKLSWPVIIIDDGSTDGSNKIIKNWIQTKPNWHFIQNPHQGKAATVATGIKAAKTEYILFTDFDQATPVAEVEKLLPFIDKKYKIVIGSREVKGAVRNKEPILRHLMGKVFNLAVKLITIKGIHDTQCGFKLLKTKTALGLFRSLKVYTPFAPKKEKHAFTGAFDVEMLFIANKRGIKIAEVPISWSHSPTDRVNPVRDSIRMFIDLLRIRTSDLIGKYKKI